MSGEDHWNWKGGITPEVEKIRKSKEYELWRRKIFARDEFRCMFPGCGNSGGELHAHHIVPINADIAEILSIENGISLCRKCHELVYGKEEQFIELFLSIVKGKKVDEQKYAKYLEIKVPEKTEIMCLWMWKIYKSS